MMKPPSSGFNLQTSRRSEFCKMRFKDNVSDDKSSLGGMMLVLSLNPNKKLSPERMMG
jgi:hypothetical protein